jgi:hypothetical protein
MSWALDEFFASVEDEFRVEIDPTRDQVTTPAEVVDYILEESPVAREMDAEDRREHVAAIVGELIAQTLGVTRYSEHSRFIEDLKK